MEFLLTQPGSVFSSSSMTWALLMTPRSPALSVICKRQTQLMFRKGNPDKKQTSTGASACMLTAQFPFAPTSGSICLIPS